jgi:hypothetical protein
MSHDQTSRPAQETDVFTSPPAHSSAAIKAHVQAYMAKHPRLRFSHAILRAYGRRWLAGLAAMCCFVVCFLLQPFWVGALLQYVADCAAGTYTDDSRYFMNTHSGYRCEARLSEAIFFTWSS